MHSEPVQDLGLGLAVYLHVDHRLGDGVLVVGVRGQDLQEPALFVAPHLYHGVDHEVDRVALAVYLHPGGVHEEGHVVVDDLDDGVGGLPAVLLELRVVDPDLPLAGLPLAREVPVGHRRPVHVDGGAVLQVLGVDPAVVLARELLCLRRLILWQLLPDPVYDPVEKLVLNQHRHTPPSRFPVVGVSVT